MLKAHGFSLFELLITLTIIGILCALALPNFTQQVAHEHRVAAEIALEKLAASLEQYSILHNTFQDATVTSLGMEERVADNSYQLNLTVLSDTEYTLTATPLDQQAEKDSLCGTLTLNNTGEKGITGQGNVNNCW